MRLRAAVAALGVLALVACHGTFPVHDWWYLSASRCGDNTAGITLFQPDPGASWMSGTTGRFHATSNPPCSAPAQTASSWIMVSTTLYKSTGLCWSGPGWTSAPGEINWYVNQAPNIGTRICNDGYYYGHTRSQMVVALNGSLPLWANDPNGLNSETDYVCYHNPCQG